MAENYLIGLIFKEKHFTGLSDKDMEAGLARDLSSLEPALTNFKIKIKRRSANEHHPFAWVEIPGVADQVLRAAIQLSIANDRYRFSRVKRKPKKKR